MATHTTTYQTDDISGEQDATTYSFAYQGTEYTIDLAEKNAAKFEKALAPFVAAATKVGGRRRGSSSGSKRQDLASIRAWAKDNGYTVSDRGRVSAEIIEAYDAAS